MSRFVTTLSLAAILGGTSGVMLAAEPETA